MSVARPLIIDTDGGVDDAAALWLALSDPGIEVVAVTTVRGVVSAREAAANILLVLEAAGRLDIPVAVGADKRAGPSPELRSATFIHGEDGLGNSRGGRIAPRQPVTETAHDLLLRLVAEREGVSVVSLGPLTNAAKAILAVPGWAAGVRELVVMGGSAARGGNALPAGEANIAHDPEAAAIVARAGWSTPPLMVGLDVTHAATLDDDDFTLLAERRTAAAAFLDEPLHFYRTYGSTFTRPGCPCHDFLAVLTLVECEVMKNAPVLPLAVCTTPGPAWGSTIVDFRAPLFAGLGGSEQVQPEGFSPWRIALEVDRDRFRDRVRALFGDAGVAAGKEMHDADHH
ncbi:MAG: nucleoside hydrolase [Rhizobiaceae bacterium]|nr:nucleoside hydrolase [Rhizobiaceae bacterium]